MIKFVLLRLAQALVTLVAVSIVLFVMVRATGNPVDMLMAIDASARDRQAMVEQLGLDRPLLDQYILWVQGAVQGEFGNSFRTRQPAIALVQERIGASLTLAALALVVAIVVAIPLGVIAATNRGKAWDRAATLVSLIGQAVPAFFLGMLLILIFGVALKWLPTSGSGTWKHFIMPAISLGWAVSAGITRLLRSSMLEVLGTEYVKFAHLKGVAPRRVVWKHALRNALIPVVTFIGFMYGIIIAAAVTTEVVFSWPGLGRLAYEAVLWRDYPLIQVTVMVWASLVIVANLAVDILYYIIDPRIRM